VPFVLTSSAFSDQGEIPARYTCEGEDISPPLSWRDAPVGTESFVLIVDDPDAPDPRAPKMTWVHWVLYNIPAGVEELAEGLRAGGLPQGALEGLNDWQRKGYGGPCPPVGRHRYFHKLHALDTVLPDLGASGKAEVEKAMADHVIERAELVGTYEKAGG
jgi:Raf kinase inhibitor-like YbhB/YbcL family protein